MKTSLHTPAETRALVEAGRPLLLAGDERLLGSLPAGQWIAGTTPYFVAEGGGVSSRDQILVTELPPSVEEVSITRYDPSTISRVFEETLGHAFAIMIVPAGSRTHLDFALHAPSYPAFGIRPLAGWVSGVHLSDLGRVAPKVFDGRTVAPVEDGAVVVRARLRKGLVADMGIVNIFDQADGPTLEFENDGYSASRVIVDGQPRPFAAWLREQGLDTALPLVADYLGTRVNVSFQSVDAATGEVRFYAPVFAGVKYHPARPLADVAGEFLRRLPEESEDRVAFSCNCILNYAKLEGRSTGVFLGPVTFGEIAFQLLNQTLVYLTIQKSAVAG